MITADVIARAAIVVVLSLAAASDLRTRRIPNWLTFGGALIGLGFNVLFDRLAGGLSSLEGWVLGVALFALPFSFGQLGAGDVKLLAAVGAWGGPHLVLLTALAGALVGAALALAVIASKGQLGAFVAPVVGWFRLNLAVALPSTNRWLAPSSANPITGDAALNVGKLQIPYGPALAVGGVLALLIA
jgi:prepilin peptidase CpaA